MALTLWRRRRRSSDEAVEVQTPEASLREEQQSEAALLKAQEKQAQEKLRHQASARRRQVAGELAASAMAWWMNAWLEGCMWLCMVLGLAVDYISSYVDLAATFAAFGYSYPVNLIMPLGIDLPATASVLGQLLAGRWKSHWWVRIRLGILTLVTAPLTLVGNALRGAIDQHGHFTFHVNLWMDLLAFAVPGLGVVVIGYVASMMQGEKAELDRRRLEAEMERLEAEQAAAAERPETSRRPATRRGGGPKPASSGKGEPTARGGRPGIPPDVIASAAASVRLAGKKLTGRNMSEALGEAGYEVTSRHANRLIPGKRAHEPEEVEQGREQPMATQATEVQLVAREGAA